MGKSTGDIRKYQKKGRPRSPRGIGAGTGILVRVSDEELGRLDAWIANQEQRLGLKLTRPMAIRSLINTAK